MSELIPRHVRRRLAALRHESSADDPLPQASSVPVESPSSRLAIAPPPALLEAQEISTQAGVCLSFRVVPRQTHEALGPWLQEAATALVGSPLDPVQRHATVYLDLETLGLSSEPIFLVGILHSTAEGFHLHQFLARDYSEELAILQACIPLLAEAEYLVSYNGRSFDWPYLADRFRHHLLEPLSPPVHVDLLLLARRLLRGKLPDCTLTTVEEKVLELKRYGDVPGSEIPPLYHQAVAEGNLELLAPVLHHNQVDLLSLACLAGHWRQHLPAHVERNQVKRS